MDYILETKQMSYYPRVRIYREFIQKLMKDSNLAVRGRTNLFNYAILCSYANYTSSRKRINGKEVFIGPGRWLCKIPELMKWFGVNKAKSIEILESLKSLGVIDYNLMFENQYVFFRIQSWNYNNSFLEYEAHCPKDDGFFFFSLNELKKFVNLKEKFSEKDIILDLWLSTVYNDSDVLGSEIAPIVYFRNGTRSSRTTYSYMAKRWSISKVGVCRVLSKLSENKYITYVTFSGRYGTAIYLNNYLSVMFRVNDVIVKKEKVAVKLKAKIRVKNEKIIVSKFKIEFYYPKQVGMLHICRVESRKYNEKIPTIIKNINRLYGNCIFKILYGHLKNERNKISEILSVEAPDSS